MVRLPRESELRMKIGMNLPVMVPGLDRRTIERWCRAIDLGPWSSLAIGERINFPNPELMTTLGFAAAVTERVTLFANVVVLPMHPEVLIAKQLATLDLLSSGRLTVGVGVGGREEDYAAVGERYGGKKLDKLEAQVARMRRVWAGENVVPGALRPVEPSPVQPGGPAVLAGALLPRSVACAARWADGICGFALTGNQAETEGLFTRAREAWSAAGRSAPPRLITGAWFALGKGARAQMDDYLARYLNFMGDMAKYIIPAVRLTSEEALVDFLAECRALGADEVLLAPTTSDVDELARAEALLG